MANRFYLQAPASPPDYASFVVQHRNNVKMEKIYGDIEEISEEELLAVSGGYNGNDERLKNVIGTVEGRCSACGHFRTLNVLFDSGVTRICECPSCQMLTRIRYK